MNWIAQLISHGVPGDTAARFLKYHTSNPAVWEGFQRFALEAAQRGKRIGAKAIAERVRWELVIHCGKDEYTLNNNYVAYYARIFAIKYPEHKAFFEFRETRGLAA